MWPTLSSQCVCLTRPFSGALAFLGADILLSTPLPWVNNWSPVSTSGIHRAEKSHQKHKISWLTKRREFLFSNSCKTALSIGKVEKKLRSWKQFTPSHSRENVLLKGTREKVWAASKMRRETQGPSEGISGQNLGRTFRNQDYRSTQSQICFSSKSLRIPDTGQGGPLSTPPPAGFLAQLTWFWFSHNLLFQRPLTFSRLGAKAKKGLQTKCYGCLSLYLHMWALTYQNNILANGSLPTDIQNVTRIETGLWSPKKGPDVSCRGALTIFLGQLSAGTIANLLGLLPRKECGSSSSSIYPHYSNTRGEVQTLTLLSCQFWRQRSLLPCLELCFF